MPCGPPYAGGSGGWCGCNCNCCPPCPCYTCWTWVYACGCNCPCPSFASPQPYEEIPSINKKNIPSLDIEFPTFEYKQLDYPQLEEYVFLENQINNTPQNLPKFIPVLPTLSKEQQLAIGNSCTIPCFFVTITLCVGTGCCFTQTSSFDSSGFSFMATNPGTVSMSVTGSDEFETSINGGGSSGYIGYGGSIVVSITPPSSSYGCCLVASFGTPLQPCPGTFRKKNMIKGTTRNYIKVDPNKLNQKIDKKKLLEKVLRTKKR